MNAYDSKFLLLRPLQGNCSHRVVAKNLIRPQKKPKVMAFARFHRTESHFCFWVIENLNKAEARRFKLSTRPLQPHLGSDSMHKIRASLIQGCQVSGSIIAALFVYFEASIAKWTWKTILLKYFAVSETVFLGILDFIKFFVTYKMWLDAMTRTSYRFDIQLSWLCHVQRTLQSRKVPSPFCLIHQNMHSHATQEQGKWDRNPPYPHVIIVLWSTFCPVMHGWVTCSAWSISLFFLAECLLSTCALKQRLNPWTANMRHSWTTWQQINMCDKKAPFRR